MVWVAKSVCADSVILHKTEGAAHAGDRDLFRGVAVQAFGAKLFAFEDIDRPVHTTRCRAQADHHSFPTRWGSA